MYEQIIVIDEYNRKSVLVIVWGDGGESTKKENV